MQRRKPPLPALTVKLSKYNVDDVALGVCKTGAEEAGVTEVRTSLSEKKFELWRNAANQVVSVGADIAFDADPKFFACLVRFESSSVPTTLPTAYDVYPLDGRHDGGYYTVKDCVTIDVLPRTPGNNVYVGFMVWSNF